MKENWFSSNIHNFYLTLKKLDKHKKISTNINDKGKYKEGSLINSKQKSFVG